MLARAARRKLRRDAFHTSTQLSEQLTLPWLCPAQMRWSATVGYGNSTALASRKQKLPATISPRHETRSLATAADLQPAQHNVPFGGFMQAWGSKLQDPQLSKLDRFDPTRPLIIHNEVSAMTPVTPPRYGVGGDPAELHQNLYACIRVGRMDRASAIVQRLAKMCNPSSPEVIDAHNIYLRGLFEHAEMNPEAVSIKEIETWYKEEIIGKTVEATGETYVTLLRAAMFFLEGSAKEQAIQKYLAEANDAGCLNEVNASDHFSEEEWDTLIRLQPDEFDEPPPLSNSMNMRLSTPAGQAIAIEHGLIPDPALSVKPVPQKGLGLSSLRSALRMFEVGQDIPYPTEMAGTEEEKDRAHAYMRQIRLEEDSLKAATERWKAEDEKLQELGIHGVLQSKPLQALMWNWHKALVPEIQQEIEAVRKVLANPSKDNSTDDRHTYGPYLETCDPEALAAITVQRAVSSSVGHRGPDDMSGLKIATLALAIGRDAENNCLEDVKRRYEASVRKHRRQTRQNLVAKLSKQKKSKRTPAPSSWIKGPHLIQAGTFPQHVKAKIGALFLEKLLKTATITVSREDPRTGKMLSSTQRAFSHQSTYSQGKRVGQIAPHHEILEKLRKEPVHDIMTIRLPMLVEPKQWTSFEKGGYYTYREGVVRIKPGDQTQTAYATSAIEKGDMDKVLAGLDTLGKVPWHINSDVVRVMIEAWNNGEAIGDLVPDQLNLEPPADLPADASYAERYQWSTTMKEYENAKSGFHSQKCFQNFQLETARAFMNQKLYFPHSVDFRGRAYPIPPILNHIGSDIARGMLKFANGKELGAVGLQWLKIHLANLYGYDKASLREREQFAMDHITDVYDSASNPLGGKRWWSKAEDPWQCLACCVELKNALESPDPTRFVSQLPVHQDGTCNGLQHYAALGGDKAGADQVNLEPSDRPQDIYTGVAEIVKEIVAEDAKNGNKVAQYIDGKITRKVVKRTVMTNVYGVTFAGAKAQVLDELKVIIPAFEQVDGIKALSVVASYVALNIFKALGRIFNGAQEIQYWLGECGDRITTSITPEQVRRIKEHYGLRTTSILKANSKDSAQKGSRAAKKLSKSMEAFRTGIIWTTPLKMPVVQPYRKDALKKVNTSLQNITIASKSMTDVVDKRKQLQAFPPNFIHSLDATHMILSALKCSEVGLDFAAVHDSFWTHAADIPNLNIILRDAFVRMHSEDIIGRLAAEFKARYAGSMYRADILVGSNVATKIHQWRKKAGNKHGRSRYDAPYEEVALEAKRQELLNSKDPELKKQGEEMVTPTSIWLAERDTMSLASFRLSLLGQTNDRKTNKIDDIRKDVLSAEAETIEEDSFAGVSNKINVTELGAVEEDDSMKESAGAEGMTIEDAEEVAEASETNKRTPAKRAAQMQVWLPLTFPPVPKKGDWDVKRLKESKYFFS